MGKNTKPKDNNNISKNLLKFPKKIPNNDKKKYESFNVVSEIGDSIYSPHYEELTTLDGRGQIFISETVIEEIVKRIIDQKIGTSLNKKIENE